MKLPALWPRLGYSVLALLTLLLGCAPIHVPPTTEHDASLPAVTLRGYRFHAQVFGDPVSPPVIVLHGGPGADYRYLLPLQDLAKDYQVLFYDQRGSGLSPRVPSDSITVDAYLADLDAMVDYLGQGRPVALLGHSWGAMLASAYTGRYPHKVAKLVLAEPGFLDAEALGRLNPGGWPGWGAVMGMARAWVLQWMVDPQGDTYARRDVMLGAALPVFQAANTCDRTTPAMPGWRAGSPAFDATIGRMQADPAFATSLNFRRGVEQFGGEVLFMAGGCSTTLGEAQQRRHMVHFRKARLEVIAQAGHNLFNDQPHQALHMVRAYLSEK